MPEVFAGLSPLGWIIWMAAVGACFGSFANVLALHWPQRLKWQWNRDVADYLERTPEALGFADTPPPGWLGRRSRCPHCQTVLGWWQLVPIFSFLMLRGRCHHCGGRISFRYPAVELVAAGVFGMLAAQQAPGVAVLMQSVLLFVLLVLTLIDLDEMLLPDDLTLPLMWLGLLYACFSGPDELFDRVVGAMAGYLSLWSVFHVFRLLTGREGMGHGDFKLLAALGAWLGWQALLPVILLASVAGSVWGLALIACKRAQRQQPIPFGPWIALGGALQVLNLNPVTPVLRVML